MLKLEHISKSFKIEKRSVKVLKNLNITFRDKEFVSILGKSGSGKSTLLNIIGLLDNEYEGNLYLKGNNITIFKHYLNDKLIRTKIGFVFQDYNLIEDLTVYQNLEISLAVKGINNKRIINSILKDFHIYKLKNKKSKFLSGGEKQKVAIARTVIANPDIILLDEPTGALDSSNSINIMNLLKKYFKDKLVIMVTHDKLLAKTYSDRIIIMTDGEILYDSDPYIDNTKRKLIIKKTKMNYINSLTYAIIGLKRKKIRNIITMIAIVISITTISFVLFLSTGFKEKIKEYKIDTFNNYPLVITSSTNKKVVKGKINRYDQTNSIYLNKSFVKQLELFCKDNKIKYLIKYDYDFKSIKNNNYFDNLKFNSYIDNKYLEDNFKLLRGHFPKNNNEVLVNVNNNKISGKVFDYFNITKTIINYDYLLGKKIKISETNFPLVVVGFVTPKNSLAFESISSDNIDFLYNQGLDKNVMNKKSYMIYVYNRKDTIKLFLEDYNSIKTENLSESFEMYLKKIVTSIEKVFLLFSLISLFISILMIVIVTYTSGIEREKEIGILKSLGAQRKDVRMIFINEMIILSLLAVFFSLTFIVMTIPLINKILEKITTLNGIIIYSFKTIIIVVLISILTGIIGSLLPAIKNSNKDVIKCLK